MRKIYLLLLSFMMLISCSNVVFANDNNQEPIITDQEISFDYDNLIDYVYIDSPEIEKGETEKIAIGIKDQYSLSNVVLNYSLEGTSYSVNVQDTSENVFLFSFTNNDIGEYLIKSLVFTYNNSQYTIDLTEKENIYFSVIEEESNDEEYEDINFVEANSLNEGLKKAAKAIDINEDGQLIVCLDPGHDNKHVGAHNTVSGINEEVYNLEIAKACRDELEMYNNVKVIMTRSDDGSCPYPTETSGGCNKNRIINAKAQGADVYIALHLNSNGDGTSLNTANGAEIYVSNYSEFHDNAKELAENILEQLVSLGFRNRGVKIRLTEDNTDIYYEDGSIKDYYGIIKNGVTYGLNSMIIEHGFISNETDANVIKSKTKEMGIADAKGIANYFNLSKGVISLSDENLVETQSVEIKVNTSLFNLEYSKSYQLISYNSEKNIWEPLTDYLSSSTIMWTPNKSGNFILGIRALNSYGATQDIAWDTVEVQELKVNLGGINITQNEEDNLKYTITPIIDTNVNNLTYNFSVCGKDGEWTELYSGKNDQVIWIPSAIGDYKLSLDAIDANGNKYNVKNDYSILAGNARINSLETDILSPQAVNTTVSLSASYDVLDDEKCDYEFLVYDGVSWQYISRNNGLNNIKWTPNKTGQYWICFQVITSTGKIYQKIIVYDIENPYVTIESVHSRETNSGLVIEAETKTNSKIVKYIWKYYDYYKQEWHYLGDSTQNSIEWKPAKGYYWINVTVVLEDETSSQLTVNFPVEKDYTIQTVKLGDISWKETNNGLKIEVQCISNSNVTYTWQYYDCVKKQWYSLETTSSNWIEWKPAKGYYWLHVIATTENGTTDQKTINFPVEKDYRVQSVKINDMTTIDRGDELLVGVNYTTNCEVTFTWQYYDCVKKQWYSLETTSSNWIEWKPNNGYYWVHVIARTSDGISDSKTITVSVNQDYNLQKVSITGMTWFEQNEELLVGVSYTSNCEITFTWQYYDYYKQTWHALETTPSNWITWRPAKGYYWIYVKATTPDGTSVDKIMTIQVNKDYNLQRVTLGDMTWFENGDELMVGVSYSSNSNVTFTWKYYDYYKQTWHALETTPSNWIVWKPQKGYYWVYVEATTPNGTSDNKIMTIEVTKDYRYHQIMGNSSITVDKMVKLFNKKAPNQYDMFNESQYNGCLALGGAPDIRTYCSIFLEEANAEGVKAEVAFSQAMLETGYLKFGGDVKPNQYNFAGLGATGGGVQGNVFKDVRTGIRAQIQHLKCYASTEPLNNPLVDQRWSNSLRGKAEYIEYLSIPNNPDRVGWAASETYAENIINIINELYTC